MKKCMEYTEVGARPRGRPKKTWRKIWKDCHARKGDADAAVETRIRIGWNKFRQLVPLLTNKDIS